MGLAERLFPVLTDQAPGSSGRVGNDVRRPSEKLVTEEENNSHYRRVFRVTEKSFGQEARPEFGFARGHKHGVLLHVVGIAMMSRMAEFPRKERNEET